MLVIGGVFVDVKGFARSTYMPLERNVGDVQVTAGGVCRNVAENLVKLGVPAQFVSMVDDNAMGGQVREGLAALGVDVQHVLAAPNGMGMWLAILDESGNLAGSISRQPNFDALEAYLIENGDAIMSDADGVVLEFDTSAAFRHQSSTMAQATPTMPMFSHRPSTKDSAVRTTTVHSSDDHRLNCTSPAARSPEDSGIAKGCTSPANMLWMITITQM